VTAIASGSDGYTPGGAARIFDTRYPSGSTGQALCAQNEGETTLGSPNLSCPGGGPGSGNGGKVNTPFANCEARGKGLIIQEGNVACPEHAGQGGKIVFEFAVPVELNYIDLLVSTDSSPVITVYYGVDQSMSFDMPMMGANGYRRQVIDRSQVYKVEVGFCSGGTVTAIDYVRCDPEGPPTKAPVIAPTKAPVRAPTKAPTGTRDEVCVDEVLDFTDFTTGEYVHDLIRSRGVTVTAIASGSDGYTPGGAARIFDTRYPSGSTGQALCAQNEGETTLGSPNLSCPGGGPGSGNGGKVNTPFANCEARGKGLIIQEGNVACPEHAGQGGKIVFEFAVPVELNYIDLLVSTDSSPVITVYYGVDQSMSFDMPMMGANGYRRQVIDRSQVYKVEVGFCSGGTVTAIDYVRCDPEEECPPSSGSVKPLPPIEVHLPPPNSKHMVFDFVVMKNQESCPPEWLH
jgi:uncharacterized Zn-binding protein involved in type VI secretion